MTLTVCPNTHIWSFFIFEIFYLDILSTIWYLGLLSWEIMLYVTPFSCTGGPFLGSLVCLAGVAGLHAVQGLVHTVAVTVQLIPGHELRMGCPVPACLTLQDLMKISNLLEPYRISVSPPKSEQNLKTIFASLLYLYLKVSLAPVLWKQEEAASGSHDRCLLCTKFNEDI